MDFKTRIVDGREIKYFTNNKGANIELVNIEPNEFGDWWAYSTIDVYINIYNEDFTKFVSFCVENFITGITGESWYEDEDDDEAEEPTEEDAWDRTLDLFGVDDYYDTWENENEFWNSFDKYNQFLEDYPDAMFDAMIDIEKIKTFCNCGNYSPIEDFEIITSEEEEDYYWDGIYKDEEERYVDMPINIGLNCSGTEKNIESSVLIDTMFVNQYIEYSRYGYCGIDDLKDKKAFVGEWLTSLCGWVRQGSLIGDYCFGGYDLPEWEDDSTLCLLRFWELTDIKNIKIKDREYTVFYSGNKYWIVDDYKAEREEDFYPVIFTANKNLPNETAEITGKILFVNGDEETVDFSIELTAIENKIIEHYYEVCESMRYFPEELYAKLVNQLKLAYLDMVKDRIDAVKSLDEIDSLECKYSFPDIECD